MAILNRCQLTSFGPRWLIIVIAALFVAGCSARFVYERVDWLVVWYIGGYVTLTDAQKESLQADVQTHLDYVRVNQLPPAAALLRKTAQEIEAGYITPQMIDSRYQEMLAQFDEFMLRVVPLSMRFLLSLDDEQTDELFENLDDINEEMYEEYSGRTAEEREKNRNKSAIRSMRQWVGTLRPSQKELLTDALARMDDASEQWIDYQREWQRRFRTLVETRPPEDEYLEELTNLFVYPRNFHTDEYRAIVDSNRAILNEALAELLTNLGNRQRSRMVKRLNGYADDLTKIAELD
jgi:hypothetical protein